MKKNCGNCDDFIIKGFGIPVKCLIFFTYGQEKFNYVCDKHVNAKSKEMKTKILSLTLGILITLFYISSLIGIGYFFITYIKSGKIQFCFYFLVCLILMVWISVENSLSRLKDKIEKGTVKIKKGVR